MAFCRTWNAPNGHLSPRGIHLLRAHEGGRAQRGTRMKKAASLLVETKLPISQISESIGILNTNYFYSVFKKKFGMTPLAYRRSTSTMHMEATNQSD